MSHWRSAMASRRESDHWEDMGPTIVLIQKSSGCGSCGNVIVIVSAGASGGSSSSSSSGSTTNSSYVL